jgi:hypothetical protein
VVSAFAQRGAKADLRVPSITGQYSMSLVFLPKSRIGLAAD